MGRGALLRISLWGNAFFSLASGIVFVGWAQTVSVQLGLVPAVYLVIGVGLLPFGAVLLWLALQRLPSPAFVLPVIVSDIGWVVGTAILLAGWSTLFTSLGRNVALAIAAAVAVFAVLQASGVLRMTANRGGRTNAKAFHVLEREIQAPADAAWPVVRNLASIARYHPALASSDVDSVSGHVRRTCVDRASRRWREELESEIPGREIVLRFDAAAPDFPFPIREMVGGWTLTPTKGGTCIRVWFEYTPKGGVLGRLVVAAALAATDRVLAATIDRMADDMKVPDTAAGAAAA